MTKLKEVDAKTAREWVEKGEAVLIDVRETDEHAREHIEGARLMPLSTFDPGAVGGTEGRKVVLHCKSGRRSAEAGSRLSGSGCEVFTLVGGIEGWRSAGLEVKRNAKVPISLMRQVQIVVGAGVAVGTGLSLASAWFLIVPGFLGLGLLFAGVTGTCALAAVLSRMPWNKGQRCGGCAG